MLLRESLQHDAGVPYDVAKSLQIQRLGTRRYIGSEGLAPAVDDG
jgi:hypothetical protein